MQELHERIRGLREDHDLSQEALARILGTSQTMYSRYERGVTELPVRHLVALCAFYHISADALLGISPEGKRDGGNKNTAK